MSDTFSLAYVPGATPGKWAGVWRDRLPDVELELVQIEPSGMPAALLEGRADIALARLPVDTDVFSRIPLYEELPVVCVHREHFLAALGEDETVAADDLADETLWLPRDDVLYAHPAQAPGKAPLDPDGAPLDGPATAAEALAIVGAGAGVTVLPMSLARLHRRKDVVFRVLDGGPTAPVGLVWPADRTTELVEEMIGIVRGRTVNSSRGVNRAAVRAADDGGPRRAEPARKGRAGSRQGEGASSRRARPSSPRNSGNKRRKRR